MATDSTNTTSADTIAQAQASASENLAVQQQLNEISQGFQTQSTALQEIRDMQKKALTSAAQGFQQM
jgi:hypothetical protein